MLRHVFFVLFFIVISSQFRSITFQKVNLIYLLKVVYMEEKET